MVDQGEVFVAVRGAFAAAVLCIVAGCASSGESGAVPSDVATASDAAAAETTVADAQDPNEMICRRERPTGSHFSRRVCRTRAQLEAEQAATQDLMRQNRGGAVNPTGSGG